MFELEDVGSVGGGSCESIVVMRQRLELKHYYNSPIVGVS